MCYEVPADRAALAAYANDFNGLGDDYNIGSERLGALRFIHAPIQNMSPTMAVMVCSKVWNGRR